MKVCFFFLQIWYMPINFLAKYLNCSLFIMIVRIIFTFLILLLVFLNIIIIVASYQNTLMHSLMQAHSLFYSTISSRIVSVMSSILSSQQKSCNQNSILHIWQNNYVSLVSLQHHQVILNLDVIPSVASKWIVLAIA